MFNSIHSNKKFRESSFWMSVGIASAYLAENTPTLVCRVLANTLFVAEIFRAIREMWITIEYFFVSQVCRLANESADVRKFQ